MANALKFGSYDLKEVGSRRVTEIGVSEINVAIQQTLDEHNRQLNAVMGLFVKRTTDFKLRYRTATAARLQPIDEIGRARPIQESGYYENAWPLQRAGTAWGATYEARIKMTVQEASDTITTLMNADARWVRDHILAAMFNNTTWTFPDEFHGDLTIKGLANADSDTYQIMTGADSAATDDHYLYNANAISNSYDPFPTIYSELVEHPENTGEVVAFVPTSNKAAAIALSNFYPVQDPNLNYGATVTTLANPLGQAFPGKYLGYHSGMVHLVEWPALPANYIVACMTVGEKALAMREEPEAALQGFKQVAVREDHPFWEAQYMRKCGFGSWNRVGAVVYRVGTGSYAIPTNYTSPMP